jgi:hypothetical protein
MREIKSFEEIQLRIREVEQQLQLIDNKIKEQLSITFFDRSWDTCRFLDLEKRIHKAKLEELKWMIYEK